LHRWNAGSAWDNEPRGTYGARPSIAKQNLELPSAAQRRAFCVPLLQHLTISNQNERENLIIAGPEHLLLHLKPICSPRSNHASAPILGGIGAEAAVQIDGFDPFTEKATLGLILLDILAFRFQDEDVARAHADKKIGLVFPDNAPMQHFKTKIKPR
jgi:hypothetical protein